MFTLGAAIASVRAVDAVAVVAARVLALRAARPASGAGAVLIVGTATRVARALAACVGVGRRRGARVRHDAASLVAGQRRTSPGTRWRETAGRSKCVNLICLVLPVGGLRSLDQNVGGLSENRFPL